MSVKMLKAKTRTTTIVEVNLNYLRSITLDDHFITETGI